MSDNNKIFELLKELHSKTSNKYINIPTICGLITKHNIGDSNKILMRLLKMRILVKDIYDRNSSTCKFNSDIKLNYQLAAKIKRELRMHTIISNETLIEKQEIIKEIPIIDKKTRGRKPGSGRPAGAKNKIKPVGHVAQPRKISKVYNMCTKLPANYKQIELFLETYKVKPIPKNGIAAILREFELNATNGVILTKFDLLNTNRTIKQSVTLDDFVKFTRQYWIVSAKRSKKGIIEELEDQQVLGETNLYSGVNKEYSFNNVSSNIGINKSDFLEVEAVTTIDPNPTVGDSIETKLSKLEDEKLTIMYATDDLNKELELLMTKIATNNSQIEKIDQGIATLEKFISLNL